MSITVVDTDTVETFTVGDHVITVTTSADGGVSSSDHGSLGGLADDDHTQYHNDARGDVRYTPIAHYTDTTNPHSVTYDQTGAISASSADSLTNKTIADYTNIVHADQVHYRVKNSSGGTLTAGTAVSYSGYNAGEDAIEVIACDNTAGVAIGLIEADILNGEFGMVTASGHLDGLDTSAYTNGQILYVNGSGQLTATEPTTGFSQPIAFVLRAKNNGSLQVLASYPKQSADDVRVTPTGDITSTDVQSALAELDAEKEPANANIQAHITTTTGNPHSVTKADVGLGNVANVDTTNASNISSGTIDLARLPQGSLERQVDVADQTARYALTTATVQNGDVVKQLDTGVMYRVIDDTNLANSVGYSEFTAGIASQVDWTGVLNKPDPTITLTGDVTGSGTMTDVTSVSFATVVGNDTHSHTHSTLPSDILVDGDVGVNVQAYSSVLQNTTASFTTADETKLDGIEALAEVNNISDVNATDLTDGGATTLHTHETLSALTYPSIRPALNLDFANSLELDPRVTFDRASTATSYDHKGRLVYSAVDTPRFDYDPSTLESKGFLIEESRENLLTYSEDFDDSDWVDTNVSILANQTTAPDGTTTSDSMVSSSTNTLQYIAQSTAISIGVSYTQSIYVKPNGLSKIRLGFGGGGFSGGEYANFDISTGVIGSSNTNTSIVDVGNGWYRCSATGTATTTGSSFTTLVALIDDISSTTLSVHTLGDDVSGIYVWGAQLEQGSFPTSYIPSNDSFTSRASTATYYDSTGTLQTASTDVARYTYNPSDLTAPSSLLLEESRTNLISYSEPTTSNVPIGSLSNWAGTPTEYHGIRLDKFTKDSVAFVEDSITASTVTWSVYFYDDGLSTGSGTIFRCEIRDASSALMVGTAFFDYDTKAFSFTETGTGTTTNNVFDFGDGLYRVSVAVTETHANTPTTARTAIYDAKQWYGGFQLEAGSYPTSYIPTTTSQVTRSADVSSSASATRSADTAVMTGTNFSDWYNQSEGTFVVEANLTNTTNDATPRVLFGVGDPAYGFGTGNFMYSTRSASASALSTISYVSGVSQILGLGDPITTSVDFSHAVAYKINDYASCVDGGTVDTDTSASVPTVLNAAIGSSTNLWTAAASSYINGHIKSLTYYPTRLSDAELQGATS